MFVQVILDEDSYVEIVSTLKFATKDYDPKSLVNENRPTKLNVERLFTSKNKGRSRKIYVFSILRHAVCAFCS